MYSIQCEPCIKIFSIFNILCDDRMYIAVYIWMDLNSKYAVDKDFVHSFFRIERGISGILRIWNL